VPILHLYWDKQVEAAAAECLRDSDLFHMLLVIITA